MRRQGKAREKEEPFKPCPGVVDTDGSCPVELQHVYAVDRGFAQPTETIRLRVSELAGRAIKLVWSSPYNERVGGVTSEVYEYNEKLYLHEANDFLGGWRWYPLRARPDDVLIVGDTYPHRRALSMLGGRYESADKGWWIPFEKASEASSLRGCSVAQSTYDTCVLCRNGVHERCSGKCNCGLLGHSKVSR